MSQHQIMIPSNPQKNPQLDDQQQPGAPVLDAYQPNHLNQQLHEQSLRQFYKSLQFPCCGDYYEPSLQPIAERKKVLGKEFVESREVVQQHKVGYYDGVYEGVGIEMREGNQGVRQRMRLVRDGRQEFFKQNSQFIIDNQFFQQHMSRLANISFQQNLAIQIYEKNAILSQRNNQKKNMPYELQINIGCLWITGHQLQNPQQRKFEQLRPIMKQFSTTSSYPTLNQIQTQIKYLISTKQKLLEHEATNQHITQIIKKIQIANSNYNRQVEKLEKLMKAIIEKWKEIKEIRRATRMETVPWRLNVKEYEIGGQKSFDIGVTAMEVSEKPVGEDSGAEISRREKIRDQRYFIKIYINGYQVAKSQKINLQWPSFRVPINQKFNVTVYSAPSSIQVQIIKVGIINKTVDTINLSLPGRHAKTITTSERRFAGASFASNGHKARRSQQDPVFPYGVVIYRIQWKGEGSRMPPVGFKAQEEQTAATEKSEDDNIQYSQLYDVKDPRFHHRTKKQQVQQEIVKAHGALLPFIDTQSARHLLLKMKATQPELQKLQIPLKQQQIFKRQDLINVIQNQKLKNQNQVGDKQIYNPIRGFFAKQENQIIKQIKQLLLKVQNLKMNILKGSSNAKYKITQQIVNQYVFQQMQSPIVVFFKNLFTQKRKLGPKITYYLQAKNVIDNMEVNLHMRAAKNVPVRESSFAKIKNFQQQVKLNSQKLQRMAMHTGNMGMYGNYGMGFFKRPPNMNIQGQNFFVPGMYGNNNNKINLQANYQIFNLQRNNSYIQMRFKKLLKRTQCFQGPYPQWNQTIQFDYSLKHENMTINKIYANSEKMIKLFLFDMTEQSKPTTSIAEARIKKSKFYLGRIDIPMSMLVAMPTLTGLFNVERPLIIFGYGIKKSGLFQIQYDPQEENRTQFPQVLTMINIDMFTEPLIDNMHAYNSDKKFTTGAESTMLLQKCSDWLSDLNTKMYIRLWLNNIDGKSVFICRYLSDFVCPPPKWQTSIQRVARFVSLIPRKYCCKLLQNTEEFHLTADQMLNLKMGEDHGILLCNYFNYIDKRSGRDYINSYLAIGKAFPYGKSIFVLRRNTRNGHCQLWDPYAGHCYFYPVTEYETICCFFKYSKKKQFQSQKDSCNMLQIGSIVTKTNVYINLQESLRPGDIDFNLEDPKLWRPFITQRIKAEFFERQIQTIQTSIPEQFYPSLVGIQSKIQTQLFQYIRSMLQSDRKKHFKPYTFKLNTNISNQIRNKLLLQCQTFKTDFRQGAHESTLYLDYNPGIKQRYTKAVQQLQVQKNRIKLKVDSDRMLYGFTLNVPYTTAYDIWERVQETHIHLNETQSVEFALAVRCFQYSCHMHSVWVFVGIVL